MKNVKDGSIILVHDNYETTVKAMERVIPGLIEEGFRMVTISELLLHIEDEIKPGSVHYGNR